MKINRSIIAMLLCFTSIVSCKQDKKEADETSQTAAAGQNFNPQSYLTLPLNIIRWPPGDVFKYAKESPQLSGLINFTAINPNEPYNYMIELNVPHEKSPRYSTKLILNVTPKSFTIDKSSVIFGQSISETVSACIANKTRPEDCIRFSQTRFLLRQNIYTLEMDDLVDPEDEWINFQLSVERDVADTYKVRLLAGDIGEDGSDFVIREGQVIGYGCRTSVHWEGCPKISKAK